MELKIAESQKELSKPDSFSGVAHLGRHQMELEKSLININKETKTISNALTREKQHIIGDPNDPINQLPYILRDVQEKAKLERIRRRKRTRNPCCHKTVCVESPDTERPLEFIGPLLPHCKDLDQHTSTARDTESSLSNRVDLGSVKQLTKEHTAITTEQDNVTEQVGSALSDNDKPDSRSDGSHNKHGGHDGPRQLKKEVEFVPESVIQKYRLTEEDIRNLPRFKTFSTGDPTNVRLYKA